MTDQPAPRICQRSGCGHPEHAHEGPCFVDRCPCETFVPPADAATEASTVTDSIPDGLFPTPEEMAQAFALDETEPRPPVIADNAPIALIYRSRSEGWPHIVTVIDDPRGSRLQCVCRATLSGRECWAQHAARTVLGLPEPVKEARP